MFIAHNALVHIHNDTIKEGKRKPWRKKRTTSHKQQKPNSEKLRLTAKKCKQERERKNQIEKNKTRANNKATSMKPDDVCAYSLRFYAKRISRLVPLLAYWFHCRQFFFHSHLSSSSILSRRLVHSYEKIMHTIAANECASFSK